MSRRKLKGQPRSPSVELPIPAIAFRTLLAHFQRHNKDLPTEAKVLNWGLIQGYLAARQELVDDGVMCVDCGVIHNGGAHGK